MRPRSSSSPATWPSRRSCIGATLLVTNDRPTLARWARSPAPSRGSWSAFVALAALRTLGVLDVTLPGGLALWQVLSDLAGLGDPHRAGRGRPVDRPAGHPAPRAAAPPRRGRAVGGDRRDRPAPGGDPGRLTRLAPLAGADGPLVDGGRQEPRHVRIRHRWRRDRRAAAPRRAARRGPARPSAASPRPGRASAAAPVRPRRPAPRGGRRAAPRRAGRAGRRRGWPPSRR